MAITLPTGSSYCPTVPRFLPYTYIFLYYFLLSLQLNIWDKGTFSDWFLLSQCFDPVPNGVPLLSLLIIFGTLPSNFYNKMINLHQDHIVYRHLHQNEYVFSLCYSNLYFSKHRLFFLYDVVAVGRLFSS